jgi:hypothetical protein
MQKNREFFAEHQQQKLLQSLEAPCKTRNLGRGVFAYSATNRKPTSKSVSEH